jgi:hypothetical protein
VRNAARGWVIAAMLLGFIATTAAAADTAPSARLTNEQAVDRALEAPERWFLGRGELDLLRPTARFDAAQRRWSVDFAYEGRRRLAVELDDATGRLTDHYFAIDDRRDSGYAEVVSLVRSNADLDRCLRTHRLLAIDARYTVRLPAWGVTLRFPNDRTARFVVQRGTITECGGPWMPPRNFVERLDRLAALLRPNLRFAPGVALVYILAMVFLLVDRRRLWSLRTLDVLALACFPPAWVLNEQVPLMTYALTYPATAYLLVRVVTRAFRPGQPVLPPRSAGVYLTAAMVLLLHHVLAPWRDTGAGHAGLLGGQMILRDRVMPYGVLEPGLATYGPLHYLLHGLVGLVFPSGVDWRTFDPEGDLNQVRITGATILAFGSYLVSLVALVGICLQHIARPKGTVPLFEKSIEKGDSPLRVALGVVTVYMLVAPSFDFLPVTSRQIAPALVLVGLWGWRRACLSGLCLALATAAMWYPVFLFPLWLTTYRGRDRLRFGLTYVLIGAAFLALVLAMSPSPQVGMKNLVSATLGVQEVVSQDGQFVTPREGPWKEFQHIIPGLDLVQRGITIAFFVGCLALALPFRKDYLRLVCLSAAVVIGTQLWKGRHSGQYLNWYGPLVMLALFVPFPRRGLSPFPTSSSEKGTVPFGADLRRASPADGSAEEDAE